MEDFIDWSTGTVNFSAKEFLFALELAKPYPTERDYKNLPDNPKILQGYLASFYDISSPFDPIDAPSSFSVMKGLPVSNGVGNAASGLSSIGLMNTSPHKEQAWKFMRQFLLSDGPELGYGFGFSINKNRFESELEAGVGRIYSPKEMEQNGLRYIGGNEADLDDWSRELMLSAGRMIRKDETIQNIVAEEASTYFVSEKTAAEIVQIIESRVRIYVAE